LSISKKSDFGEQIERDNPAKDLAGIRQAA
jgi:hypothetical protein